MPGDGNHGGMADHQPKEQVFDEINDPYGGH